MEELEDLREVMGCPCLRIRRATRLITQLYDRVLANVDLTANQFGLLAYLQGADRQGGLSIGTLAERVGVDPTTLNRNLKPLEAEGLIANAPDKTDGRVRKVAITRKGRSRLAKALPLWRRARGQVEAAIGSQELDRLNELLDLAGAKVLRAA
jgi:DNA-binding MarR family transcriptional regulator